MLAYGYQMFARTPATGPEVYVDGIPMSSIVGRTGWAGLRTSTRLTGDWQITWEMIRHPRKRLVRHPALRIGAPVVGRLGPIVVAVGSLTEPDWDSGELVAVGAPREAENVLALTAAGTMTTRPNTSVDQAIARGALNWIRRGDFGDAPLAAADGSGNLNSVARVLDARSDNIDEDAGWRVDRRRGLRSVTDEETDPMWFVSPGAGELGTANDERVDRVFVRYIKSGAAGGLDTASYPAVTPAGGTERGADITYKGAITATEAAKIAEGIWRKMQRAAGWANGVNVDRSQVTTRGGLAANLALIKAGDAMRLLGASDPRGLAHHIDVVIGDTEYDWTAKTIQLNPVGLAARTFESVLEDDYPGASAL